MTEQEAIEILNTKAHLDCKIEEAIDEMKARCVAIEALEKQIPKKPITKQLGSDIEVTCPVCNYCRIYMDSTKGNNYCSECGQKLDWGE